MTGGPATSLRLRLSLAFAAVAALAVGLATLLSTRGLEPRLDDAAEARFARTLDGLAETAAGRYRRDGRWSRAAARDLEHVGLTAGVRLVVHGPSGRPVRTPDSTTLLGGPAEPGESTRPIELEGRRVGTLRAAPLGGSLLEPADLDLRESLDRLHMLAAAIAIAIALAAAILLAKVMSDPLRRIRAVAQRIERGDLAAHAEPGGDAEVRAVAHALNRLAETLEHEERVRKESVADLAHELRTPVSGLISRIEAAQDGVLPDTRGNLAAMHAEAARLARLLDDLDSLAAAERPGMLLDKQPLDLAAVAAAEAERMQDRFDDKGVALERDLEPTEIVGDSARIAQIATNLLSNGLRCTEPGGSVRLRVAREDGAAVLAVSDTGIGIEPADLEHIFKRFWRADKSRSRATGGTGIGLAIVRELVIAHEGRIDVDSVPGAGSTFRVTLPTSASAVGGDGDAVAQAVDVSRRS